MIDDRDLNIIIKGLKTLIETDKVDKIALQAIHQQTAVRIFVQGKKADGSQIGIYSKEYQKVRRKKNYPSSSKIIFVAKGTMQNDYSFISERVGSYGSGFKSNKNFEISEHLEKKKGIVWKLTKEENDNISVAYGDAIEQLIKGFK